MDNPIATASPLRLLGQRLDAILDRGRRQLPVVPTPAQRLDRYADALALAGEAPDHDRSAVRGAELQANLGAYGTTIDLRLVAQAMCRMDLAARAAPARGTVTRLRGRRG